MGPFRRWLGKMGLISDVSEEQIPTAELPKPDFSPDPEPEPELLTQQELEITTADTKPLQPEMAEEQIRSESTPDEPAMESKSNQTERSSVMIERGSGPLLDLGDFEPARAAAEEDFVLDLDFDDRLPTLSSSDAVTEQFSTPASQFSGDAVVVASEVDYSRSEEHTAVNESAAESLDLTSDPMAQTQEMMRPDLNAPSQVASVRAFPEPEISEGEPLRMVAPVTGSGQITLEQLSPEAIDAIARRAVEMLSERVVQEIAWEVVPQLAELLIKRQLEEKSS